jgi:hypothetical protein
MEYKRVNTDFWEKIKLHCCSLEARLIALYLLTSTHRRSEGLFRIPDFYIAGDLNLPLKVVQKSLKELETAEFLACDSANNLIFIKKLLKHQLSRKQQLTAIKRLDNLAQSPLFENLLKTARLYNPDFAELLAKNLKHKLTPGLKPSSKRAEYLKVNNSELSVSIPNKIKKFEKEKDPTTKEAVRLSQKLLKLIQKNNPRTVLPTPEPTDSDFRLWIETIKDLKLLGPPAAEPGADKGYSWTEIEKLIELSQQQSFWKKIILDAQALRKHIIKIENQLLSQKDNSDNKMEMLAQLYAEAAEEDNRCKKKK